MSWDGSSNATSGHVRSNTAHQQETLEPEDTPTFAEHPALDSSIAVDASLGPIIVKEKQRASPATTTPSLPVGALNPTRVLPQLRSRRKRSRGKLFLGGALALSALGVAGYLTLWPDPLPQEASAALRSQQALPRLTDPATPKAPAAPLLTKAEPVKVEAQKLVHIEIVTSPLGARVSLDGEPLGETPLIREIPYSKKKATLKIEKDGFAPMEISFTPNATYRNTFSLKPPTQSPPRNTASSDKSKPQKAKNSKSAPPQATPHQPTPPQADPASPPQKKKKGKSLNPFRKKR